ncbi:hypothetical protein CBER1_10695 [Cercospora berteroae]|uniref:DUF7918 domain-containing protein n=1 Tax=Cercospora berteroae TaxID=357750 RepID=A0A2S6BWY9_9PEZI|nr:hypothetical protein CBER1_10695 [Cercospora berteroae]
MILDLMPQLTAEILVDGDILQEYDDEDAFPAKDHRTQYIEAEPGHNFTVRAMTNPQMAKVPQDCVAAHVYFDGKHVGGAVIDTGNSLGPTEQRGRKIKYLNQEYPYSTSAFATFTFKCRSRTDLQIMGVMPRSPSPVPLEERDPNTLTLEESRELVRRMREREREQQTEIKKEGQKKSAKRARSETLEADSDDEAVLVTGERPAQKRSRQSTDSGVEIVDLTED